jgi:hypothetical protein
MAADSVVNFSVCSLARPRPLLLAHLWLAQVSSGSAPTRNPSLVVDLPSPRAFRPRRSPQSSTSATSSQTHHVARCRARIAAAAYRARSRRRTRCSLAGSARRCWQVLFCFLSTAFAFTDCRAGVVSAAVRLCCRTVGLNLRPLTGAAFVVALSLAGGPRHARRTAQWTRLGRPERRLESALRREFNFKTQ